MISNLIPKQVITIIQSQINFTLGIKTLLSGGRDNINNFNIILMQSM